MGVRQPNSAHPGLDPGSRASSPEVLREVPDQVRDTRSFRPLPCHSAFPMARGSASLGSITWSCGSDRERCLRSRSQSNPPVMDCPDELGRALRGEKGEDFGCRSSFPETPAKAGVQGNMFAIETAGRFGPWIPACAGICGEIGIGYQIPLIPG